jgi:hypothetical protein
MIGASIIGGIVIGLLLRGGPQGAGGAAVNLGALRDFLEQKKTYICAVLLALNNYAARKGYIDAALASDLNTALALLTGIAVVAKMNRIEQKTETAVTASKIAAVNREPAIPREGL